jgi:hypothetical protein
MEKLAKFAAQAGKMDSDNLLAQIDRDLDIFGLFKKYIDKIIEE